MFPEDLSESARGPVAVRPSRFVAPGARIYAPATQRVWLNALLFIATLFTTTLVGAHMQYNFSHNLPFFDVNNDLNIFTVGLRSPALFLSGLPFSLTLLTILMAHELGHYLACMYYDLDATLPFFLPAPTLIGTFGAFIRIRSGIYRKRVLFDVGIAGPIAGFVFLIPALGAGLAFSKIIPGINHQGTIQLGAPLLQSLVERMVFPGVPASDIYLHPVARAAWFGMFATALNLLPVGQLDGGHIIYALIGRAHKWITWVVFAALLPMGRFWWEWWALAVIIVIFARRHPPVYDESYIGAPRVKLGVLALFVFIVCFSIAPIIGG